MFFQRDVQILQTIRAKYILNIRVCRHKAANIFQFIFNDSALHDAKSVGNRNVTE